MLPVWKPFFASPQSDNAAGADSLQITRLVYKRTSIADEMREGHRRRVLGE
jgi:hypothetical protein